MVFFHEGGGGGVPSGLAIALHRPRYMLALLITSWLDHNDPISVPCLSDNQSTTVHFIDTNNSLVYYLVVSSSL